MTFSQENYIKAAKELGRSNEFIKETINYASYLQSRKFPVIFSIYHLSEILQIEFQKLLEYIENREKFYKYYTIRKRFNNGRRQITVPSNGLKAIQKFISIQILRNLEVHNSATGFVKGKSILDNAKIHSGNHAILNIDLFKFFDCITERDVYKVFKSIGYAGNLAVDFAKICTVNLPYNYFNSFSSYERKLYKEIIPFKTSVLPQGAPTSPILSNLVLRNLDNRLNHLCLKSGLSYSRYADDITISGKYNSLPKLSLIDYIIRDEGFRINWKKVGVYTKGKRQLVTGLTVTDGIHVPRKFKRDVQKHLYACLKFGVVEHLKFLELDGVDFYREWLLGKVYYIYSVEPDLGKKLLIQFNNINWSD